MATLSAISVLLDYFQPVGGESNPRRKSTQPWDAVIAFREVQRLGINQVWSVYLVCLLVVTTRMVNRLCSTLTGFMTASWHSFQCTTRLSPGTRRHWVSAAVESFVQASSRTLCAVLVSLGCDRCSYICRVPYTIMKQLHM